MKAFLRENPTIAFGLGLPLLLVGVFLLISGVPALLVAPPKYDVLYATEYYNYGNGVQISVVNQKVQVVYLGAVQAYQKPRLWRYYAKTGAMQEIAIVPPPGLAQPGQSSSAEAATKIIPIDVPDVANLAVDGSSIAPDGYQFSGGDTSYSRDIFTGLFAFSRYREEPVLTKQGRSIRLPNAGGVYYGNYARFIGWVVSQ
jgi:phage tail protein X